MENDRPGKQKGNLKIENDEQQRDEIEARVKTHARVVEWIEAALVRRELFGVGRLESDNERSDQKRPCDESRQDKEHDQWQIIGNQARHRPSSLVSTKRARKPPRHFDAGPTVAVGLS